MVILESKQQAMTVWQFEAEVNILSSNLTTIKVGYEPNIHVNNISQVCVILGIENNGGILRAGEKALVRFCFKYSPQYLGEGNRIVFRENRVRGVGIIKRVIGGKRPDIPKKLKKNNG